MSKKIRNIVSILLLLATFFLPFIVVNTLGNDNVLITFSVHSNHVFGTIAAIMWIAAIAISPEAWFHKND